MYSYVFDRDLQLLFLQFFNTTKNVAVNQKKRGFLSIAANFGQKNVISIVTKFYIPAFYVKRKIIGSQGLSFSDICSLRYALSALQLNL